MEHNLDGDTSDPRSEKSPLYDPTHEGHGIFMGDTLFLTCKPRKRALLDAVSWNLFGQIWSRNPKTYSGIVKQFGCNASRSHAQQCNIMQCSSSNMFQLLSLRPFCLVSDQIHSRSFHTFHHGPSERKCSLPNKYRHWTNHRSHKLTPWPLDPLFSPH